MAETTNGRTLLELGPGVGSAVERIKVTSRGLRGNLRDELARDTTHFGESDIQLLKFHGSYQQEDRSQRPARKSAGLEPAYSMMLRLRIPAGALDAKQYLALDELADRYGNGTLRFTTRQSIQFHGILKGDLWGAIHDINETLLSTRSACGDVNRNVMACPAPLRSRALLGIDAMAERIALHLAPRSSSYHEIWIDGERLTGPQLAANALSPPAPEATPEDEPIYGATYLPRKFKIGIAYPGDNCIDVFTQDIGLISEVRGDAGHERLAGFTLVIGGGMGMTHGKTETHPVTALPFAFVTPDEAIEVITAIVTVQRDYGDRTNRKRARMKYVVEERGIPWFREEVERRLGRRLEDPHAIAFDDVYDHLGWHEQPDGRWFLGISIENGRVYDIDRPASAKSAANHRVERPLALRSGLRTVVAQVGCGLHLTPQQNVLLCDIPADRREDVERVLQQHGIVVDAERLGIHRYAMACPALPTCGLALTDAERTLPALIDGIQHILNELGAGSERLSVRMTGCPNGCSRPYMGDIGIVGRSLNLYDVFVGGDWENTRLNQVAFQKVKSADLIATLRPAIESWIRERSAGETFGDYHHRVGFDALQTAAVGTAV